ncbi:glucosidase II beta subunit-like-domain-containing protein [Rhizophagus clarus]|uniref:Glucosidase 2 subunit beta n=1 Tax=Rhizophagus clarus TaxID=94130 RepID=A0A8H3L271_9GLOM|nr:glucosidase II beta subunit-like-domain-containing protein [Rhizophagus clarus]
MLCIVVMIKLNKFSKSTNYRKFPTNRICSNFNIFRFVQNYVYAGQENIPKGVAKSEAHLYEKKGPTWKCLDGSTTIPYEAINDDYCDCVDGSDEPGTSACPNGKFFCTNSGHIPSYIPSNRVNDGVCEPECCDGSDEYDGKIECPNICEEVGAEYRRLAEELAKTRAKGAQIKSEYIKYGIKSKQNLESDLERLKTLLESAKIKVAEREAALKKVQEKEEAESKTKDHMRIQKCQEKIRTLREREESLHEQVDTLLSILKDMKKDHNQNYHDMAVKTAIKGYDEFVEEYEREMEENTELDQEDEIEIETLDHMHIQKCQEKIKTLREREEKLREQVDTLLSILKDMKKDHNQNYHDMAVKTAIKGYDEFVEEYEREMEENTEPDQEDEIGYEEVKEAAPRAPEIDISLPSYSERILSAILDVYNDILETFGLSEYVIRKAEQQYSRPSAGGKSKDLVAAFDAYDKAEEERKNIENDINEINRKLEKDYGTQREFAKLDSECFSHDAKDYTYTICMFDKATQKSNKDHVTTHLGYFEKWIGAESKEDHKYYTAQSYTRGTRCWNGPDRSVKLYLECGIENKILSVTEPEKCEYILKMITPAVCPLIEKLSHEEL